MVYPIAMRTSLVSILSLLILNFVFLSHPLYAQEQLTGTIESITPTTQSILIGDANNDCQVDGIDFSTWLGHYNMNTPNGVRDGDFDTNGKVDGVDFVNWISSYGLTCDTIGALPTPPFQGNELDISVCEPTKNTQPFSANITNPYNPFWVGQVSVFESPDGERVRVTVLPGTERIDGIDARIVEEYETVNGQLEEISNNYFAQASDGTVCYFGEYVTEYSGGQPVAHEGTWRAGGPNKPGIQMPAHPVMNQAYLQEYAPGIAVDWAHHFAFEDSYAVPFGTFHNVLLVDENPLSTKRYAPGVGMIFDDDAVLVSQR